MLTSEALYQQQANEIKALRKALLFLLKRELSYDIKRLDMAWDRNWLKHRIEKDKEKLRLLGYEPDENHTK